MLAAGVGIRERLKPLSLSGRASQQTSAWPLWFFRAQQRTTLRGQTSQLVRCPGHTPGYSGYVLAFKGGRGGKVCVLNKPPRVCEMVSSTAKWSITVMILQILQILLLLFFLPNV